MQLNEHLPTKKFFICIRDNNISTGLLCKDHFVLRTYCSDASFLMSAWDIVRKQIISLVR